ncbi:hypothetical protein C8F04DRAFT_1184175 [Mycena alexandri]|uniref:Uncharacterized protein n=1 Tax=Mycena alexandri TaxID=1745969 RepID=A0AAD6SW25_9AGAR|nr:hypothetical protein C8F04DRAFT_1184175 [Mycena alexandri]
MLFGLTIHGHNYAVRLSRTDTGVLVVEAQGLGNPHCSGHFLLQDSPDLPYVPPHVFRGPPLNSAELVALQNAVRHSFFRRAAGWRIDLSTLPLHTLTDFPPRRLGSIARNDPRE